MLLCRSRFKASGLRLPKVSDRKKTSKVGGPGTAWRQGRFDGQADPITPEPHTRRRPPSGSSSSNHVSAASDEDLEVIGVPDVDKERAAKKRSV